MITHILAALPSPVPKGPHSVPVNGSTAQANRDFESWAFIAGCAWLACLIFFQWARDMSDSIPGGLATSVVICLGIIGISAFLLR